MIISKWSAGLTISVSLNVRNADGKSCVVQKVLVFDAVFQVESQTIEDDDDVFGGQVTVCLTYENTPDCEYLKDAPYSENDESEVDRPEYDEVLEVRASILSQKKHKDCL